MTPGAYPDVLADCDPPGYGPSSRRPPTSAGGGVRQGAGELEPAEPVEPVEDGGVGLGAVAVGQRGQDGAGLAEVAGERAAG